jgi:hypothetical protein
MADSLMLVLGCDCDPDRPRYGGARYDTQRSAQTWHGISEGIDLLMDCLDRVHTATGVNPRVVFCIRSDIQMKEVYGAAAWPLTTYADTWRHIENAGHELAWHPHLWRWSAENECWFQETRDSAWIEECLATGFSAFRDELGRIPVTCHTGWTYHSDVTMKTISDLGVRIDFSACPNVCYGGGPGDAGTTFDNRIDWLGTPQKWYRPSVADYRRPARAGEAELALIEIPKFTSRSFVLRAAKGMASGPAISSGTNVFLQVTALPLLYRRVIAERLRCEEAEPFFATYFHPDELLRDRSNSWRGFLYSSENLERNLTTLIEAARKQGRDVVFVTGAEAVRHVAGSVAD